MDINESVYCRLCAELKPHKKLLNLQNDSEKCLDVVNKLSRFHVQIDFNDEILPKTTCFSCINALNNAFEFVTGVELAQSALHDLILTKEIKKEESLSDNENFLSTQPAPVAFEYTVDIKVETEKKKSTSKTKLKKSKKKVNTKKVKKGCYSLDALPISELKLTWENFTWQCGLCETQFPTIDELQSHSMQYHSVCNPYYCVDCKTRKLRLDSFLVHVKRHRNYLKFSCYKCSMKFSKLFEATKHKETHKSSDHICSGCNMCFKNEDELTKHASSYFKRLRGEPLLEQKLSTDSLTCTICNRTCKNKNTLATHMLIHTDRKKTHTCEICGQCFFQKGHLVSHTLRHSDARPHQCEICKLTFKTPRCLRLHAGVHDGEKPYSCDKCGRCFRQKCQLKRHLIVHTDSLPYLCTYCNKRFRFRAILNQHVRQHTGVKPYSCTICQRDFTNWPNFNKHMKCRHGMDMAKRKRTPAGTYPIDPATGEVIYPEEEKLNEWKKKIVDYKRIRQPKKSKIDATDTKTQTATNEVSLTNKSDGQLKLVESDNS